MDRSSMDIEKLNTMKDEMDQLQIDILDIIKLKWIGIEHFP